VTAGAAGALGEMVGAIFVAADADLALGRSGIFVAGVTGRARAVLGLRVEAGKLLDLVTGRAGRHAGHSRWTVRAMTGHTAGAELPVGALLLGAVAIGAHFLRR
jgi:hypothetical protein